MSAQSSPQIAASSRHRPAKAAHYSSALSAALLHGAWSDGHAGKDAKGHEISWGELVRKWGKHTGGNTSLIHHLRDISLLYLSAHSTAQTTASGYITVSTPSASPSQSARNPAAIQQADGHHSSNSSADAGESSQSGSGSSFIHVPHPHLRRTKSKPSLDQTRAAIAASGPSDGGSTARPSEKAAYLASGDLDGDSGEGDEYWAEGGGWWHGVGLDQVDEVREGIRHLEDGMAGGKSKDGESEFTRLLLAYHYHAIGEHTSALAAFDKISWTESPGNGLLGSEAAALDRVRGRCLQGMSYELLDTASPSALQSYLAIIPTMATIFPPPVPSYLSSSTTASASRLSFESNRELHRWLSTALCRAAILSSRHQKPITQTLRILRTYHAYAASWPSSFRPHQRHRMLLLYLTALSLGYPQNNVPATSPYLLTGAETSLPARVTWRKEATLALREGQRLLSQTTSFPRAGAVNRPVRGFTDLSVALADRSPALTLTVIDVLYWSMTLTFQSQSVLRQLTRLQHRKGQDADAKRTFELYVQLVLKSRETSQPEVSLHLEDSPLDEAEAGNVVARERRKSIISGVDSPTNDDAGGLGDEQEAETDGDGQFLEAMLVGVRTICREMGDLEEGWRYACLARDLVKKPGTDRISRKVRAAVEEVLGIVRMAMATTAADPSTRPQYQSQAINHLITANQLDPTSAEILYHLSYAQAEARSVDDATQSIHSSLEFDPDNVQGWHLLALLLTAKKDWEGARKACEAGIAVWEADDMSSGAAEDDEEDGEESSDAPPLDASLGSRDFALPPSRSSTTDQSLPTSAISPLLRPSGRIVYLPKAHPLKSSRSSRLQNVIRLRTTLNVITEKTEGAGMAMLQQQELFAFFSARSGEGRRQFGYNAGGMRTLTSMSSAGSLGGSYVSVIGAGSAIDGLVNVHPPTPVPAQGYTLDNPPRVTHSPASGETTPDRAGTDNEDGVETINRDFAEKGSIKDEKEGRRSVALSSRKSLKRHLHLPGSKGLSNGQAGDLANRNRTASNSSAALSVASTAVHSNFRGIGSSTRSRQPSGVPSIAPEPVPVGRTSGESRILSNLWLMSAATFRRWGKLEQCLVAINEAETLDPENGDVWIQLGLYHSALSPPNTQAAQSAYTKAILLRPLSPTGLIQLSNLYLGSGEVDLAHTILNEVTQDSGWDLPEAWVLLARACKAQGRESRERECLIYALALEQTKGARGWRDAVDRWL